MRPCLKTFGVAQVRKLLPCRDECVLKCILGGTAVAQDSERDSKERVADLADENGERLPVAPLGLLNDGLVHGTPLVPTHLDRSTHYECPKKRKRSAHGFFSRERPPVPARRVRVPARRRLQAVATNRRRSRLPSASPGASC